MAVATEEAVSGQDRLTGGQVLNDAWSFLLDVGRARLVDAEMVSDSERINDFTETRTGFRSQGPQTDGAGMGPLLLLIGGAALVWVMTR